MFTTAAAEVWIAGRIGRYSRRMDRAPSVCDRSRSHRTPAAEPDTPSRRGAARLTDAPHVPMVRAAAAAQHVDLRQAPAQRAILRTELVGIAGVEVGRLVELLVAPLRRVGADAADACRPRRLRRQDVLEVARVRAVDHVVGGRAGGDAVDLPDRVGQRLAGWQAAVSLER